MFNIILTIHIILAVLIISLVLMQQGKGADLGSSFGGGSSQNLFGAKGVATLLSKITAIATVLFFSTSITLTVLTKKDQTTSSVDSVLNGNSVPANKTQPASQSNLVKPKKQSQQSNQPAGTTIPD